MKRTELVVGTEYVTDKGLRVTVKDTEPGWVVNGGEPTKDLATSVRFISGKKAESNYLLNTNVLVEWTRSDGSVVPLAMPPRALRATWADYEAAPAAHKDLMLKYGIDQYRKRLPEAEQEEAGIEALHKRWQDRLREAGVVEPDVLLSKDGQHVTVGASDLHKVLAKAGV